MKARPRERIIRRAIAKPEKIVISQRARGFRFTLPAPLLLPFGFLVIILVGSLLLTLPVSNQTGDYTPYIVALFTSTSAVCITGLVVVDTGTYWSPFGQAVILLLIQVGGLGIITLSTFLLILIGRRVSLTDRVLLGSTQGLTSLAGIIKLTKQIVIVTFLIELIGASILFLRFAQEIPIDIALWRGVFHSISAFNNAGFDLIGDFRSLTPYNQDPTILLSISALVILGSIGYPVLFSIAYQRAYRYLPLDAKLVLWITTILLVGGTLGLFVMEHRNLFTFGLMSLPHQILNAFFMTVSRTSGFSTVEVGSMTEGSQLLLMALMYIGGGAGSAAGGIKVATFGVIIAAVLSSARGRRSVTVFDREIPLADVMRAMSIALLALSLVFVLTLVLTFTEPFSLSQLLFDAFSAFGTVGLSTGITPSLSVVGKLLTVVTMYLGRIGPLTVAIALAERSKPEAYKYPEGEIKIG